VIIAGVVVVIIGLLAVAVYALSRALRQADKEGYL
jgi:Na+-transporting methylmalonyl-CoA/oxaloacetate decarboxylase gamma subunit